MQRFLRRDLRDGRQAFERQSTVLLASAGSPDSHQILYLDIDRLPIINETFGMHVGDSVLGQLGELIRRRLPPGAFASRISGDRFAVLLPT